MLARIADALRKVCSEVILVGRLDQDDAVADAAIALGMRIATDSFAEAGPIAGLEAGLSTAQTDLSFVTGGDHPFLSPELIAAMADAAERYDAVVPKVDGMLQPLHAIYRRSWLPLVRDALRNGRLSPLDMLNDAIASGSPNVRVFERPEIETADPSLQSLFDIDTPEQLAQAERMLGGQGHIRRDIPPGDA